MYEDKICEYKKSKEDLELNLNQNIVFYKMKEDELDTLMMVMEGILVKSIEIYFIIINYLHVYRAKREINMIIISPDYHLKLKKL